LTASVVSYFILNKKNLKMMNSNSGVKNIFNSYNIFKKKEKYDGKIKKY
jgi:hypothetical protein